MSVSARAYTPITRTDIGATNLVEIVPGTGVRTVWITSTVALWLCYGFADGIALPTDAKFYIPAGLAWPAEVIGSSMAVASSSGTATVSFMGIL